jgi:hypothetical protein
MALVRLSAIKLLAPHQRSNWQCMNHITVMVKLAGKTEIRFCVAAEILNCIIRRGAGADKSLASLILPMGGLQHKQKNFSSMG